MKATRAAHREGRRETALADRPDSYRAVAKREHPAHCPRCGAAYNKGRWTWGAAAANAERQTCPACQRIEDDFPAGYVTLKGAFFNAHRDEVLNLVATHGARARDEHPMHRIIGVEPLEKGVRVTTTDIHLARVIAQAVHNAFHGTLEFRYSKDECLVRATWSR